MSTNTNPLPPGMNSIAIISPCLQSLIIGHTFLILFIPLLVALFYYSTPYSRRQPIFILNVLALTLAFTAGVVTDALNIHMLLSPQNMWSESAQLQITIGFIGAFQGMLVDAILLVRLITVHPLSRIGFVRFALLTSLPIALKITRTVNIILYINQLSIVANGPNTFQEVDSAWLTLPYLKVEWVSQMVDNSYASIAFLWTIRSFRTDTMSDILMSTVSFRQSSFAERVRILSNLALSNFIIPSVISIVQLALLFRFGDANPILLNDIAFVNAMVSVFGVAFATVWAGKEHRREAKMSQNSFPVEREQRCINYGLDRWRGDNVSSAKDMVNQDDDLVDGRDIALLPQLCEPGSAIQRTVRLSGD